MRRPTQIYERTGFCDPEEDVGGPWGRGNPLWYARHGRKERIDLLVCLLAGRGREVALWGPFGRPGSTARTNEMRFRPSA